MPLDLLKSLVTALFIGALVGTERTHHQQDDAEDFGGLRTFVLVAELGAVLAWVSRTLSSPGVLVAGFIGVGLLTAVAYLAGHLRGDDRPGMTTEVAALVVLLFKLD